MEGALSRLEQPEGAGFIKPLLSIVNLFATHLLLEKTSDVSRYRDPLTEFFVYTGKMLCSLEKIVAPEVGPISIEISILRK